MKKLIITKLIVSNTALVTIFVTCCEDHEKGGIRENEQIESVVIMDTISAQVVLKTAEGKSLLDETAPPGKDTVSSLIPAPETVTHVQQYLRKLGFEVDKKVSGPTITISAPRKLFQEVFGASLVESGSGENQRFKWKNKIRVPKPIESSVATVLFPKAPDFFQSNPAKQKNNINNKTRKQQSK